ncbi:hypothetical protein QFZ74_000078 [Streptomyces sp. V3I7]|nr:hypothetical protein [Streptomyces sp. V3I7]
MLAGLSQLLVLQLQDLHDADQLLDLEHEVIAFFAQRLSLCRELSRPMRVAKRHQRGGSTGGRASIWARSASHRSTGRAPRVRCWRRLAMASQGSAAKAGSVGSCCAPGYLGRDVTDGLCSSAI